MFRKKYHYYKEKFNVLKKIVLLVYKEAFFIAISRDFLFLIETAANMLIITVGGFFIDATAEILLNWEYFNLREYFVTDSFLYLVYGLILWMFANISSKIRANFKDKIDNRLSYKMQEEVLAKISRSNLQDVEDDRFRDLLAFVPTFSYSSILFTYDTFSELLRHMITAGAAIAILYDSIGWSVILLVLFALPEVVFAHLNRTSIRKYNDSQTERLKVLDYLSYVTTRIPFFTELRVDNTFTRLVKSFAKEANIYVRNLLEKISHFYIDTALFAQTGRLMMTGYAIYILAVSIAKRFTIGHFKALYDYAVAAYNSSFHFMNSASQISNNIEYSRRYFEYIEFQGFGDMEHGEIKLKSGTPTLEFKDLDFSYPGGEKKVLEDINLKIKTGEKIAIIGLDGAGKSSLIKILCGLYKITAGDYEIGGYSIREIARGELKKKISGAFEDFVHYNMSLKENVSLADEKGRVNSKLYNEVMKIVGMDEVVKKGEIRESQVLGKYFADGLEISPGNWQRLAIARMLYRNREIFIMDEPFTHIDSASQKNILSKVIEFIGKERTLIYITQSDSNLEMFDHVYLLKDGKLTKKKVTKM